MPQPRVRFLCELIGTAVLLLAGLSLVIVMFGTGSPIEPLLPSVPLRQVITGFLFGSVGGSIALSRVGKESGAHINPAVTLAFWLMGKIESRVALGYMAAQLAGAVLGCIPLLAWGEMGRSIAFGATVPGPGYSNMAALLGEALTTLGLVSTLCIFIGLRPLRPYTPFTMPVLYAFMVPLEAIISGTSTNPARTLGPAVISGEWTGWWIYWLGPLAGTLASVALFTFLGMKVQEAKLYHFENDQRKIFRTRESTGTIGT
jgi:aquaporin Z